MDVLNTCFMSVMVWVSSVETTGHKRTDMDNIPKECKTHHQNLLTTIKSCLDKFSCLLFAAWTSTLLLSWISSRVIEYWSPSSELIHVTLTCTTSTNTLQIQIQVINSSLYLSSFFLPIVDAFIIIGTNKARDELIIGPRKVTRNWQIASKLPVVKKLRFQ